MMFSMVTGAWTARQLQSSLHHLDLLEKSTLVGVHLLSYRPSHGSCIVVYATH